MTMQRRHLCGIGIIAALLEPLAPLAQPAGKMVRIGFLGNQNPTTESGIVEAFRQGLRELGWIEGQNVAIEYRWADGNMGALSALALALVKLPVDVLLVAGSQGLRAARQATSTIPIVGGAMPDPVSVGAAASLARPGGNVTGLANLFEELAPKQLQLFKELLPRATRIAMLFDPGTLPGMRSATEAAARTLGLNTRVFQIRDAADLEAAINTAKNERADGLHILPSPMLGRHRARIAELALKHGLPSITGARENVLDGVLMSYGPSLPGMYRRAASFVDRILKGAKPGDLAIEQPTKFELVLSRKTAKALGLTIPQSLLLRADEVID